NGPVSQLLEMSGVSEPVVFVRDPNDKHLWHAVGFTTRSSEQFFTRTERVKPDDFAPIDLLHIEKKEKTGWNPTKPTELKPTRLANPAKDIVVLSDRAESVPEFFRRQRVIAGALDAQVVALLAAGKSPADK